MYKTLRPLPDQITLSHGPHELLNRYFALAEDRMREIGVRLRLRSDFDALMEINREHRDSWSEMLPICDPAHSNLRFDSAFWLEGIDQRGDTVLTHAARFFDFTGTNVVEEIRSLRVYYENPAPHIRAGERVDIDAPAATAVRGRTMYGGAIWVHPDWRRFGLTRVIVRICSAYAHTRWNTAFTWGFMNPRLHSLGLSQAYGPYRTTDRITASLAYSAGPKQRLLLWMDTKMMLADLATIVAQAADERASQGYAHDSGLSARLLPGQ
jgi:hypothetical protein